MAIHKKPVFGLFTHIIVGSFGPMQAKMEILMYIWTAILIIGIKVI